MNCRVGLALLVCAAPARAAGELTDILHAPPALLDALEQTLWDMVEELGLRDDVVDMVVVGSFAYGVARPRTDARPSDLDVILYLRRLAPTKEQQREGYAAFRAAVQRRQKVWRDRLPELAGVALDVKPDLRQLSTHAADPDWVGYSLLERRVYNRPDGKPRQLHGYFHNDTYYVFDRAAFSVFQAELRRRSRRLMVRAEAGGLAFYDQDEWERGGRTALVRSLPKAGEPALK